MLDKIDDPSSPLLCIHAFSDFSAAVAAAENYTYFMLALQVWSIVMVVRKEMLFILMIIRVIVMVIKMIMITTTTMSTLYPSPTQQTSRDNG